MALKEKLEQIKTLVESGAGGGGEKKWYEYDGRPSYYPHIPDFDECDTAILVCKWNKYGKNGLNLRIYPSTTTTMDIYVDDVFKETISVTNGAGTVFQNNTTYVNFDDLKLKGKDDNEKMFVIKIISKSYITNIDLSDNYSYKYENIKEIYTNAKYGVLNTSSDYFSLETFYNMNFTKSYSKTQCFSLYKSHIKNLFLPKDVVIPLNSLYAVDCGKYLKKHIFSVVYSMVDFSGIYDMDKINLSLSDITYNIKIGTSEPGVAANEINFIGSFGGNSKTSSLTFKIGKYANCFTRDSFLKMANEIEENTNGNTRTFSIYSGIYNTLTEDDISILTNKGYTVASATS